MYYRRKLDAMNLDEAVALLKTRDTVDASAIDAFRVTCTGIWTTAAEFCDLLTHELGHFLSRFGQQYRRESSFERVATAIRDLFKSPEIAAIISPERLAEVRAYFRANWKTALRAEIARRDGAVDVPVPDRQDVHDAVMEDDAAPADTDWQQAFARVHAAFLAEKRDKQAALDRMSTMKSAFVAYVRAGEDAAERYAALASALDIAFT
jgi:hypothetical protein